MCQIVMIKREAFQKTFNRFSRLKRKLDIYGNGSIWLISLVLILYAFIIIDKLYLRACENSVI